MPLVSDPTQVSFLYHSAVEQGVCLANFCTENTYTTEAIFRAVFEFGGAHGNPGLPIIIAATGHYASEPQLLKYTHLQDARMGLKALIEDVERLAAPDSPYHAIQVMLHFDHGQPDLDASLLELAADKFATLMFDASAMPFDRNIQATAEFVRRMAGRVLVEGAVSEIPEALSQDKLPLTTADQAEKFLQQTGAFLIVPDLGTEHRSLAAVAHYDGKRARQIRDRTGKRMVLHGLSSLQEEHFAALADDGIVKVNIWTVLEKVGSEAVARFMVDNLPNILPAQVIETLYSEGKLGEHFLPFIKGNQSAQPRREYFLEAARRQVWQNAVVQKMKYFLTHLKYAQLKTRADA
jgi:fructose/tagatose bisphosphate aldolase